MLEAMGCSSHHRWLLFPKSLAGKLVGAVSGIPRKVNTIYLEHIAQNTQPNLLKNTAAATQVRNVRLKASS